MSAIMYGLRTIFQLLGDLATFIWLNLYPQGALAAENLFLRKQLAMYLEHKRGHVSLICPCGSRSCCYQDYLTGRLHGLLSSPRLRAVGNVRGSSCSGAGNHAPGTPIHVDLRQRIREIAWYNPSWGGERIANILLPTTRYE